MDAAGGRRGVRRGYGLASLALTGLYPLLPEAWRGVNLPVVCAGAVACVLYGRRAVRRDRRRPWTLLVWALAVFSAANVLPLVLDEQALAAGRLVDASGNLLLFAAALTLIMRCGTGDPGGVIDSAVIALAAGSLLWAVLPHRLGPDDSFPAQLDLFVVVFTHTGVLGALLRLTRTVIEPGSALWRLLAAVGLAIGGNLVLALAGSDRVGDVLAHMLFLLAFTAIGMFGLDPTGPRLVYPQDTAVDRLSAGRLVFLCAAVAVIPVVIGVRALLAGDIAGLLLAVQGALIAVLVMGRIGLLAAQRAQAERALAHQATHDPLTRLPNRQDFVTRLREELRRGSPCVLLFCDLDDFKFVNDRYGHEAGDRLLTEVAHRLRACVRPSDLVSRFGGDEFVVLLVDAALADGEAVRACIASTVGRPIDTAGGVRIGISIGIAEAGPDRDPDHLIRSADRDMYRVKASRAAR